MKSSALPVKAACQALRRETGNEIGKWLRAAVRLVPDVTVMTQALDKAD